jgi:hypothetical protein
MLVIGAIGLVDEGCMFAWVAICCQTICFYAIVRPQISF